MTATQGNTTKQRKMAAGQDKAQTGGRSALRALRLGLARAARDVFGMPLSVIGATQTRAAQEALPAHLSDERLLILLDGPDRAIGVASLDRACLAALIQQQTMGMVTGTEPVERPYTGTDASLAAPLIDAVLERAANLSDSIADKQCLTGFRFGARADSVRALMLAVEAERFRIFDLTVEFDGGPGQGALCLVLPEPVKGAQEDAGAIAGRGVRMGRAVGNARADLTVVIGRLQVSLSELTQMRLDDVLPLQEPLIDRADLVGINGQKIATARLGQAGGLRAVRLNETAMGRHRQRTDGDFEPNALTPPPEAETGVTLDMPTAPGVPAVWEDQNSDAPAPMAGFPTLEDSDDDALDPLGDLSPDAAAKEISALAGLTLDGAEDVDPSWPKEDV